MIIYLDLDGVIINWVKGVCDWYKIPYEPEKVTYYDALQKLTNTNKNEFWNNIKTPAFWENLETYPHTDSFIKQLNELGTVILLSSPAYGCAGYRQNWIQKYLPDFFYKNHYVLTHMKWLCANKDTVLIDDSDKNCFDFSGFGYIILYPQPWNNIRKLFSYKNSIKDKNDHVIKSIVKLKKSLET